MVEFSFFLGAFSFANFNTMTVCCFMVRNRTNVIQTIKNFIVITVDSYSFIWFCDFPKVSIMIVTILVCLGCQNKYHRLSGLNTEMYLSQFWKLGVKCKVWFDLVSAESVSWLMNSLLVVSSRDGRREISVFLFLYIHRFYQTRPHRYDVIYP